MIALVGGFTSCATQCYVSPFPDFVYQDAYTNKLTVISRGMFAKDIDTTFLKSNLSGLQLNTQLTADTLRFDYTISEIEKIYPTVYLLYVEAKPRTKNAQIISQYAGCVNYKLTTKKVDGKLEIEAVKQIEFKGCLWMEDMRTKRSFCR